jgi:hypothetical protein
VNGKKDLSGELLEKLREHPDPVTARLNPGSTGGR